MSVKIRRAIFDFETGGLDCKKNPITEVAIQITDERYKVIDSYEAIVKPYDGLVIEPIALQTQGRVLSDLDAGEDIKVVADNLVNIFRKHSINNKNGKSILCGHNVGFDIAFLKEVISKSSFKTDLSKLVQSNNGEIDRLDSLQMARFFWDRDWKSDEANSISLSNACKRVGIKLINAHNAMPDVDATRKLLKYFSNLSETKEEKEVEKESDKSRKFFQF